MATSFDTMYGTVRALVGDRDPEVYLYSNAVLTQHFVAIADIEISLALTYTSTAYNEDLTAAQKAEVILRAAINLIAPNPEKMYYKNPVTSVMRDGMTALLYAHLNERLSDILGGSFPVESQGDIEAIVQGAERFTLDFDTAQSATPTA